METELLNQVLTGITRSMKEYNSIIRRGGHDLDTYDERRGMFYNTLKRNISLGRGGYWNSIQCSDIACVFNSDREIVNFKITGHLSKFGEYDGYSNHIMRYEGDMLTLYTIYEVTQKMEEYYDTLPLNRMAIIVNSINPKS